MVGWDVPVWNLATGLDWTDLGRTSFARKALLFTALPGIQQDGRNRMGQGWGIVTTHLAQRIERSIQEADTGGQRTNPSASLGVLSIDVCFLHFASYIIHLVTHAAVWQAGEP